MTAPTKAPPTDEVDLFYCAECGSVLLEGREKWCEGCEPEDHDHFADDSDVLELLLDYDLPELAETYEEGLARDTANKFLWVLSKLEGEKRANEAEYTNLMASYGEAHVSRQNSLDAQIQFLTEQRLQPLFGYCDTGKKKSLKLLNGTIGERTSKRKLVVEDEELAIAWCERFAPDIVRVVRSIKKKEAGKALDDGSKIEGVITVEGEKVFYAKAVTR